MNMRRRFILLLSATLLCGCAGTKNAGGGGLAGQPSDGGGAGGLSLMEAIERSARKIAEELPEGSRVAIAAFESEDEKLSDYIMEELAGALFDRGIEVADRQNLEYVYREFDFQTSGAVSDASIVAVGNLLAADMVITGQLLDVGASYRYRISAVGMKSAARTSVSRQDVRGGEARRLIEALAGQKIVVKSAKYGTVEQKPPQSAGAFLDRGIMFASKGEFETAVKDFDEALKLDKGMEAAYALRARALIASAPSFDSAGGNYSGVVTIALTGEGIPKEAIQIYDRAISDYTQAIRFDPQNAKYYLERGDVHVNKGDYVKAISDYESALRIEPGNDAAKLSLEKARLLRDQ